MANIQMNTDFMKEIASTRDRIRECFKRSHAALVVREDSLLNRVDAIEREYRSRKEEINRELESLTKAKSFNADTLTSNTLIDTRIEVHNSIDRKIAELTADTDNSIEFEWDNLIETDIEQLGSIKLNGQMNISPIRTFSLRVKPIVPDYKAKQLPTAYCCKKSSDQKAPGEVNCPRGIGLHYATGNIYITDRDNHRVQVLSSNGDYLFMFSANMNQPRGICIFNDSVFVTQLSGNCVNKYKLDGSLLKTAGTKGSGEEQFYKPHCLDFSSRTNNIYVCDTSNHRVQILTENLEFHSLLGIGMLHCPIDVKATRDRVLVLDKSEQCMFVFSSNHVLTNRILGRGYGKQTHNPRFFDIDREYNIILTDFKSNCIYVFTQNGDYIHKIGRSGQGIGEFDRPAGIALDNTGRIIVVCEKNNACVQFF